jgi:hypothetical protein
VGGGNIEKQDILEAIIFDEIMKSPTLVAIYFDNLQYRKLFYGWYKQILMNFM